jgi:DNA-directed RNA polymerase III subunit RPC2
VSIFVNQSHRAIYIASDGGRLCRPLIIVENCQPRLSLTHMEKLERGELTFSDFLRNVLY